MPDGLSLLASFNGGVSWTDITTHTAADSGLAWRRGMSGGGPNDRVAPTGQCEFAMQNGFEDGAPMPIGYYAFNSPSVRSGWTFGTPIRVQYTLSGVDYPLWTGALRSATPTPGLSGPRRVACVAVDCINALAETDVRAVAPQINQTENQVIAAIIAALPTAARPSSVAYDASLDTFPYALDDASSGAKALSLITNVAISSQAFVYPKGDGSLRVENRQARPTAASAYHFTDADLTDCVVPADLSGVYNRVRLWTHPRRVETSISVLYGLTSPQLVRQGATLTIWGDYASPGNDLKLIGGTGFQALVGGTDYAGNDNQDGSGTNRTGVLTVTATPYAASVKFDITSAGFDVWLVNGAGTPLLQLRGQAILDNAPVSVEWATAQPYGERLLEIDLPYQADATKAMDIALFLERQYRYQAPVNAIAYEAYASTALLQQAVTREIGDVITVTETMSGLSAADAVIQGIEGRAMPGRLEMRYTLAPRITQTSLVLDHPTYGVLDSALACLGFA